MESPEICTWSFPFKSWYNKTLCPGMNLSYNCYGNWTLNIFWHICLMLPVIFEGETCWHRIPDGRNKWLETGGGHGLGMRNWDGKSTWALWTRAMIHQESKHKKKGSSGHDLGRRRGFLQAPRNYCTKIVCCLCWSLLPMPGTQWWCLHANLLCTPWNFAKSKWNTLFQGSPRAG